MAGLVPFKVGQGSPANTFLAIWMALDAGLYAAHGLDVEIVPMAGGRDSGPALSEGRIDLMHIGMSSVIRANAAGADLVTIGSLSNVIRSALFAAPGIETAAGLKGGTVGISSAGSESEPTTVLALERLGLARDDVTWREIGVNRLDALHAGTIAATMLGEPHRSTAIKRGLEPLVDLLADRIPWVYSGLVVHRPSLRTKPDQVRRFTMATIEGNALALTGPARAKAVLARELAIADPAIADVAYDNFRAATPRDAAASRAGAANVIATVATGTASRNIDDYLDTSLTDALRADGFIDETARKYAITGE